MTSTTFTVLQDPNNKFTDSTAQTFTNKAGDFAIEYGKEDEVRMGLFACDVKVFKNGKDVSKQVFEKYFSATLPIQFEPMSFKGLFTFIPTCPIRQDSRLVILNTGTLEKNFIDIQGATTANQFAKNSNLLIITGYTRVLLYNCDTRDYLTIFIKGDNQYIEYAYFSYDETKIIMLLTDRKQATQTIRVYNLDGILVEETVIKPPSELFDFDFKKYEHLSKADRFNLFNSSGYNFVAAGRQLNMWSFMNHNKVDNTLVLRTYVPVSEIYHNREWKEEGCDIRVKEAAISIVTE